MANLRSKLYMLLIAAMFAGSAFMVGFIPMPDDVIVGGKSEFDNPSGIEAGQLAAQHAESIGFRAREGP